MSKTTPKLSETKELYGSLGENLNIPLTPEEIIHDYRLAYQSRQVSLIGRREVLSGKAKFGIFGDGKELPQLAMARFFRPGDFRAGYYRDQTFIFACGLATVQQFFAQLYAHTDLDADPATGGRAMNAHFASRSLNPDGSWKDLTAQLNSSADVSPTAAQMPRLVGLAYASRLYRELEELKGFSDFSRHGDEVAFGTIGNASTSEGVFWEAVNAIGVLKCPAIITIYDDGYGISVPNEYQMVKQDISALLSGFQRLPGARDGFDLYAVLGWDYPALLQVYRQASETARAEHVPALIHVTELTQPQGHSTSGSQERYKSKERLAWEQQHDGLQRLRSWILDQEIVAPDELEQIEKEDRQWVEDQRRQAWDAYQEPIRLERNQVVKLIRDAAVKSSHPPELTHVADMLGANSTPLRRDNMVATREALLLLREDNASLRQPLIAWTEAQEPLNAERYHSHLYSNSPEVSPANSPHRGNLHRDIAARPWL